MIKKHCLTLFLPMLMNLIASLTGMLTGSLNATAQTKIPADSVIQTRHVITIKGQRIQYTAHKGTQPVWNDNGDAIATLDYTYYERDGVSDRSRRPLVISFNGGPGSASVWMQIGYTGPALLEIDAEGYPVQPYGIKENNHSILDIADIIFVNPVNTGYSRILDDKADRSTFFGINADIRYLANWINTFVTRQNRWLSPKFLIGESYGTTRVAGLAHELQSNHWMYLNGVVLVSPTDLGVKRDGPVGAALKLPYFAATAWYHQQLPPDLQQKDLTQLLPEVEAFTVDEFIPALVRAGSLSAVEKTNLAAKLSRYSGLSKQVLLQNNLQIPTNFFWKELLREEGYTVGRLDSRYRGIDKQDAGDRPDFNSELTAWLHAFTPAINHYMRTVLGFKTDLQYNMFGPVHPWNRDNDRTGENLRQAMAQNPYLNVLVQAGYYDGACDYFSAKYNMWQLDPSGRLQDRIYFEDYRSGHMMYLRKEDLERANEDLRAFIRLSIPEPGMPAKY